MRQIRSPDEVHDHGGDAGRKCRRAAVSYRSIYSLRRFGRFSCIAGIYGVVVYAVGQRTNEIGVRIALGAGPGGVVRLVLGQGLLLAGIGLGLGFAASIAGTRLLKSMLFQVQPNDPWVYTAVAVMVGVVTLVAGYVPASRAAKIDPVAALREE